MTPYFNIQATVFLAASASARADPYFIGNPSLGYGLTGYPYAGPSYSGVDYARLSYPGLGYSGYSGYPAATATPIVHQVVKREAEAGPHYGPYSLGYNGYGYGAGYGLGAGYGYRGFGYNPYFGHTGLGLRTPALAHGGVVRVSKREAEAEAYYGPYNLGYAGYGPAFGAGYGYMGLGYPANFGHGLLGYPTLGLGYRAPVTDVTVDYKAPVAEVNAVVETPAVVTDEVAVEDEVPSDAAPLDDASSPLGEAILENARHVDAGTPYVSLIVTGNAPAAIPAVGGAYAGAGRYVANSAGVVHVAKREAEAEAEADADAQYGAYGLGYSRLPVGLAHPGYSYPGLRHFGYPALGNTHYGFPGYGYAGLGFGRHGLAGLGYGYAAPLSSHLGYTAPLDIDASAEPSIESSSSGSASQTILGDAPASIPAIRGV